MGYLANSWQGYIEFQIETSLSLIGACVIYKQNSNTKIHNKALFLPVEGEIHRGSNNEMDESK